MRLIWIWLGATLAMVLAALIWSFAPILVPMLAVLAALGVLVCAIVALARRLERSRGGHSPPASSDP